MTSEEPAAAEAGKASSPPLAMASEAPQADPWRERRALLAERLRLALEWQAWLMAGGKRRAAEIARREHLSRARVCQIVTLAKLVPEVQADLFCGDGPVPSEKELYDLARRPEAGQEATYRELCDRAGHGPVRSAGAPHATGQKRTDFQQLFARARRYLALLDEGVVRSLREIGRMEGVTGTRIGQVLMLLQLAPEIIAALDVPPVRCPYVSAGQILAIARLKDWDEQRLAYQALITQASSQ